MGQVGEAIGNPGRKTQTRQKGEFEEAGRAHPVKLVAQPDIAVVKANDAKSCRAQRRDKFVRPQR